MGANVTVIGDFWLSNPANEAYFLTEADKAEIAERFGENPCMQSQNFVTVWDAERTPREIHCVRHNLDTVIVRFVRLWGEARP